MFWIPWVLALPGMIKAIGNPHYECGEHGRFEYCIDGVPGCIIGCHCHPGYYFDTDTKICEPNAKLVLEYKRLFGESSPTRVPKIYLPDNALDLGPTPTPASAVVDAQVENIAKESDDLGDWLYNQFFRTIESQVINHTDSNTDKPSRRSGNLEIPKKMYPKTRTGKNGKISRNSKKKKTDLRRKLLRITEDDSLFDSSSGSSEDSSSSGSSSSDSSSAGSSETVIPGRKDSDHAHRRILMINKKPKPPLPSFIFLPQMQTPFFPPIGLPPPALPMYPMVPVPPMFVPGQQNKPCPSTTAASEKKDSGEKKHEDKDESTKTPVPVPPDESKKPNDNEKKDNNKEDNSLRILRANKRAQRKKFLKQLQQRMQNSKVSGIMGNLKRLRKTERPLPMEEFESPMSNDAFPPMDPNELPSSPGGNVDFKYLGQLIHKIDNKTGGSNSPVNGPPDLPQGHSIFSHKQPPNIPTNGSPFLLPDFSAGGPPNISPPQNNPANAPPNNEVPTRRFGDANDALSNNNRRFLEFPDDSYYSNLGKQIAGLIRKIDGNSGPSRLDIEIERSETPPLSVVNQNSYTPRSYWERSVRSLLKEYRPYLDDAYRQTQYQDSLFNLEKKVETVATTTKPLSLPELENYVVLMDKAKSKNQQTTTAPGAISTEVDSSSLNVDLLNRQNEQDNFENSNIPYPNNEYDDLNLDPKNDEYHNPEIEHKPNGYGITNSEPKQDNYDQQKNKMQNIDYAKFQLNTYINNQKTSQKVYNNNLQPKTETKYNNYGYFEPSTRFWTEKAYNNSEAVRRVVTQNNLSERQNNLRGLLLTNFKNIHPLTKHLSYNMRDISISNKALINNQKINIRDLPMHATINKQNDTLSKLNNSAITRIKPQNMVGAKLNAVAQAWKRASHVPWVLPGIAKIVSHNNVYRISDKHTNPYQHPPINIQFQISPKKNYQTFKSYGDQIYTRHSQTPIKMLAPEDSKAESPLFQHHLLHHFNIFND